MGFLTDWKVILAAALLAFAIFAVYEFESEIKSAAYQQFYAKDVEQALAEKQKEVDRLEQLRQIDKKTIIDVMRQQAIQTARTKELLESLKSKADGPLAPVLRDTLRSLGGTAK